MIKEKTKPSSNKTAITFLSGSAGELDWLMPILSLILNQGFKLKIIFLSNHVYSSIRKNKMLNDFVHQQNVNLEVFHHTGPYLERFERLTYLTHRFFLKFKFNEFVFLRSFHLLLNRIFGIIFLWKFPLNFLDFAEDVDLVLSEYPSLRRPRDTWFKSKFKKSIFFYFPHSPHIYGEDINTESNETKPIDCSKHNFLLLGHPSDYSMINDGKELADPNLEKVFIGHPKYSDIWLKDLKDEAKRYQLESASRDKVNILVLSRGIGSYLDNQSHSNLVETTINTINTLVPNYNLLIKKHPRELISSWDEHLDKNTSIQIVNEHILEIAKNVDFVISFWSSGAMDCNTLGVPVIEYFDPNKHSKQQISEGEGFTTIYRKLGIVFPANNEIELGRVVSSLVKSNATKAKITPHSFYNDLMNKSNKWDKTIEKILLHHRLIDEYDTDHIETSV